METWLLFGHHRRPDIEDLCDHVDTLHIVSLSSSPYIRICIRYIEWKVSVPPCLGARKNSISTLNFTKLALARVKDVQRSKRQFSAITTLPGWRCLVEKFGNDVLSHLARIYKQPTKRYPLILAFESLTRLNRTVFRFLLRFIEMCVDAFGKASIIIRSNIIVALYFRLLVLSKWIIFFSFKI